MTTTRTICTCPNVNEPVDHPEQCQLWGDDKFKHGTAVWSREFWRLVSFMEWASEHREFTIFQLADAWPNRERLLDGAEDDPNEAELGDRTVGEVLDDIEHQKLLDNNLVEVLNDEEETTEELSGPQPCPGCKASNLQCAECGYMAEDCECGGGPDVFYCPACTHIFELVTKDAEKETEQVMAQIEVEEIEPKTDAKANIKTDIKTDDTPKKPDTPYEIKCWCKQPKQFACVPCGVERKDKDEDWHYTTKHDAWCSCKPQKDNYCWSCGVEKKKNCDDKDMWFYLQSAWEVRNDELVRKNQSYSATSWNGSTTGTFSKCRHYEEPITFPDGTTIWASSNFTRDLEKGDVPPDFGLYCASSWQPASLAYLVAWPDFGIPKYEKAAVDAIKSAFEMAKAGKVVEVGCVGGHGRTGTTLACLAILGGVKPKQAVKYVRKNYCDHAVEGDKQKWWVLHFADLIFGTKKAGKMPVAKSSSTVNVHTVENHYNMYKANKVCESGIWNAKEKKKDPCKFWNEDFEDFEKGKVPVSTIKTGGGSGKAGMNGTSTTPSQGASSASKAGGSGKALASAATRAANSVTPTSSPTASAGETEDDAPFRTSANCLRPNCGTVMSWGVEKCPKCGLYYAEAFWTWHLKKNKQIAKDQAVWNKQLEKDAETWQTTPEELASREPSQLSFREQNPPSVGAVEDDYVWTGDVYGWVPEHLSGIVLEQQAEESRPKPKSETRRQKRRRLRLEQERNTQLGRDKKNK